MLENFRNMKSNAMQHLIPPSPFRDEGKVVYVVTVTTGSMKYAGTDSNVSIAITGASGDKTSLVKLDKSFHDDFERGSVDRFKVKLEDIGQPVILTIKYDESGMFADWFVVSVTIQKAGDSAIYRFPINMWVTGTTDVAIGTAKLPQHEENPVLISHRKNELAIKKREIRWRSQEDEEAKGLPGYIAGSCMEDLPRNFRLDEGMLKEFDETKKNTKNFLFNKFQGVIDKCDNLAEIKNVFLHPKLPKIPDFHQNWERDEEFGRQLMNGCDPTIIKRCESIPKKFPVTNSMVGSLLTRGITLEEEMKEGNIYIVDLEILEGIPCGKNPLNNSVFFSCAPLCLLYANCKGDLVPVAIQLWQQPGLNNPIWTPKDSDCDWMIAKMYFRNAESNVQMMSEKLLLTHLVLEPFAVGIRRCLSFNHPLLKLLSPHLQYVCGGNMFIRKNLISAGGALDRLMSYGGGSQQHVIQAAYRYFNFDNLNLRKLLACNGTDDTTKLPGYYFRDDGLLLWDCIRRFVRKIIKIFYQSNEDVQSDEELQKCIKEIRNEGFAWQDGKDKGVPNSFLTTDELIDFATSIIFTATCRCAALTNGIFDVYINVPNSPFSTSLPPPTQKGKTNHDVVMQTLPSKPLSCLQASVVHSFSKQPEDQVYLSDYPTTLFNEDSAQRAVVNFRDELQRLSSDIRSRNEGSRIPYEYLLPEKIPIAASI